MAPEPKLGGEAAQGNGQDPFALALRTLHAPFPSDVTLARPPSAAHHHALLDHSEADKILPSLPVDCAVEWLVSGGGARGHIQTDGSCRMMTSSEIERVQAYLRRLLGTERISVIPPRQAGMSVEIEAGGEVIGTLHRDTEDGEVSYAAHLTILEEDLSPVAQSLRTPASPALKRKR